MMGVEVGHVSCMLALESLKHWLQVPLLWNYTELQSVVGKLVWAAPFVPDLKEVIALLECLLACDHKVQDVEYTTTINRLVALVL